MNTPKPIAWNDSTDPSSSRKSKFSIVSLSSGVLLAALLAGCKPEGSNKTLKSIDTAANEPSTPLPPASQLDPVPQPNMTVTNVEPTAPPASVVVAPLTNGTPPSGVVTGAKKAPGSALGAGKTYVVNKGDTLFRIARVNGVTVNALTEANPKLKTSKLKSGQKIQIPAPTSSAAAGIGFVEPGSGATAASGSAGNVHVVKAGETLTQIARQHGTTVKALQAANQMKVTRVLVGQKIKLPAAPAPHGAPAPASAAPTITKVSDASPGLKP